jgi:hypothetical protein
LLDEPTALTIDASGNAYISGITFSSDFPATAEAFQRGNNSAPVGGFNAFVTKMNPAGSGLVYSTYLGGSQDQGTNLGSSYWTNPVAVDKSGNVYVAGFTQSHDFPVTSSAFQQKIKGVNITLSKLNPSGSALVYSTYLGGSASSFSEGLAVDGAGDAYVTGFTYDTDFPVTSGAFHSTNKASYSMTNGFLTKFNPTGSALVYSTYLGGTAGSYGGDGILGLAVDGAGHAFVTGYVMSDDFPVTANAFQTKNHGATQCCTESTYATNTFLTEFNPAGTALVYSTYFGGTGVQNPDGPGAYGDSSYGVALGSGGSVISVGAASSADFPVSKDSLETKFHSAQNMGFVAKFDLGAAPAAADTVTTLAASANPVLPGTSITFTATVAALSGSAVPSGDMLFSVDEATVATVALNSAGKAVWTTSALAAGAHYVLASYEGNTTYASSGDGFNEVITPAAPVVSPAGGTYESQQIVTMVSPSKTGVVYYTLDGSAPSRFSTAYSKPIVVNYSTTVKALSVAGNIADSTATTQTYKIVDSPWVLAAPATGIGTAGAELNAFVNTQGLAGTYVFLYGTSGIALNTSSAATALSASSKQVEAQAALTGLKSKTTYYYQVQVTTAAGVSTSKVLSFMTK